MAFLYSIYGLILEVPFPCPMLVTMPADTKPDITVMEGPVPFNLPDAVVKVDNWQAAPKRFLLRGGRRSGRFLVEDGQKITLQRNATAEDEQLFVSLVTGVLAALLTQRGHLVLHASVVITPRGAVAISGESGAGKSTTQAALLTRGCQMMTDDVTVLRQDENGSIMILPGISKINLCEDAAIKLGFDVEGMHRNQIGTSKVVVRVDKNQMVASPMPIKELFLLSRHPGKEIILTPLRGAMKFYRLQECFSGPIFPEDHPNIFAIISTLAEQIEMKTLERPNHGCSVTKVVEAILNG